MAKAMNLPFISIFEDDAYPCDKVEEKLKDALEHIPNDADCVVLGYNKV